MGVEVRGRRVCVEHEPFYRKGTAVPDPCSEKARSEKELIHPEHGIDEHLAERVDDLEVRLIYAGAALLQR